MAVSGIAIFSATSSNWCWPAALQRGLSVGILVVLSYAMIVLDISIVLTALPRLQADLGFSDAGLTWVSSIYTLFFGGFLLLGGKLGDLYGRRRIYMIGLSIFALASLAIGSAQSAGFIVAARAVQGMGAAILAPSTLSLLQVTFPAGEERNRAVAWYAAAAGVSASFGMVLGGVLADMISWRAGFFINLPISIGLLIVALRYVKETDRFAGKIDVLGALLSTIGLGALVFASVHAAEQGWGNWGSIGVLALGFVLLAAFLIHEARVHEPLLPLRLLTHAERGGAYGARVLFLGANVSFYFFLAQYMQEVLGLTAAETGLAFFPATFVNFIAAMNVPKMMARFGRGPVLMVFVGFGQGAAMAPLTSSGIAGVEAEDVGAASGTVNVAHQLGSSLGLALLVALAALTSTTGATRLAIAERTAHALQGGTLFVLAALLVSWMFILRPASEKQ
ncbi:MFS transporter [uncultured Cohaesibacter sp.]|uniref:MFS transporter n=1 Tax=uncultured Cohaesibacter sp. TaxID=1002546 RepID=UPI0029C7D7AE|nr:MFS transporter [uncultured Cohaesibacter sp.]